MCHSFPGNPIDSSDIFATAALTGAKLRATLAAQGFCQGEKTAGAQAG
jgi:hypothetical protein